MSAPLVEMETRGSVAVITLNRPDLSNTLNLQMAMDLLAAAMTCGRNSAVRAVVLTGAGKNFCFGGDLRGMIAKGKAADAYLRELDYGVAAICGGMCSCATCHIYVDPEWADKLPAPQSDERELLNELSHHTEE